MKAFRAGHQRATGVGGRHAVPGPARLRRRGVQGGGSGSGGLGGWGPTRRTSEAGEAGPDPPSNSGALGATVAERGERQAMGGFDYFSRLNPARLRSDRIGSGIGPLTRYKSRVTRTLINCDSRVYYHAVNLFADPSPRPHPRPPLRGPPPPPRNCYLPIKHPSPSAST